MKKRKELLEKFINENFDLTKFCISWIDDFMLSLIDNTGDKLDLICYDNETVCSYINDKKFLSYSLEKDLCNNFYWKVI